MKGKSGKHWREESDLSVCKENIGKKAQKQDP